MYYYIIKIKKKGLADFYGKTPLLHVARAMKKEADKIRGGTFKIFKQL